MCTTELGYMARIKPEFDKRGVKIIGISVDPAESHAKWASDIKETQGYAPSYPMVGDPTLVYPMTTEGAQALHPHRAPAWQAD